MKQTIAIVAATCLLFSFPSCNSFAPQSATTFAPMKKSSFIVPHGRHAAATAAVVLRMSEDAEAEAKKLRDQAQKLKEEAAELAGTTVEKMETASTPAETEKKSGDMYIDELPPPKDPLSPAMRERLMREASTGLDSNQKQTNVILYISIAVAILVLLGGKDILY